MKILDSKHACCADGQLAGLVQYLQKRLRTLEGENTSLEQVVSRLKIDAKVASTRATQADQARLETAEKLRNSLRTQEEHNHQMQQIQELNLLRESNVTLRLVPWTSNLVVHCFFSSRVGIMYLEHPLPMVSNSCYTGFARCQSHSFSILLHQCFFPGHKNPAVGLRVRMHVV